MGRMRVCERLEQVGRAMVRNSGRVPGKLVLAR
jgi:hypothetical protein